MDKPMKIAMMVRAYIPAPRPRDMIYAPIDLAVAIAKGLGARGHKITLFSPLGTEVHGENVTVESMNLQPLVKNQSDFDEFLANTEFLANDGPGLRDRFMSNEMFVRADKGEFDLLHFHHPDTALSTAGRYPNVPIAYTLHDPIRPWLKENLDLYRTSNQHYISISNNQRRDAPDLPYLETVYNGTNVDLFTFSDKHEDYLLYTGRITPEKGVKEAIQVARASNHRLLIIGPIHHTSFGYFEQYIKPELDDQILYLGRVDQDVLPKYYQKAKAVLTPIQWEEPFGLTTIEAMACGTPVISLHRGAAPEIIVDGKTGFVVPSVNDMIDAVGKIDQINRIDCRRHVEAKFSVKQMVDNYEAAYRKLLGEQEPLQTSTHFIKRKMREVRRILPNLITE